MTEVIFLTGHRKSGTTMLHRLFDDHPGLNVYPPDISLFYGYFPKFAATLDEAAARARVALVTRKSFERVARRLPDGTALPEGMAGFADHLAAALSAEALRDRGRMLAELLACWTAYTGCDPALPVVVKETSQAGALAAFRTAPGLNIRMIALTRDPRDNYAALKAGVARYYAKMSESERETLASALSRIKYDFTAAAIQAEAGRLTTLRFEDLTRDPDRTMRDLAETLGLEYRDSLTRPTTFGRPYAGNNHDGKAFDGISAAHLGDWPQRISAEEAQIIEFWLAAEMARFGYTPAFEPADRLAGFARFYDWYNTAYFFHDSFTM